MTLAGVCRAQSLRFAKSWKSVFGTALVTC